MRSITMASLALLAAVASPAAANEVRGRLILMEEPEPERVSVHASEGLANKVTLALALSSALAFAAWGSRPRRVRNRVRISAR